MPRPKGTLFTRRWSSYRPARAPAIRAPQEHFLFRGQLQGNASHAIQACTATEARPARPVQLGPSVLAGRKPARRAQPGRIRRRWEVPLKACACNAPTVIARSPARRPARSAPRALTPCPETLSARRARMTRFPLQDRHVVASVPDCSGCWIVCARRRRRLNVGPQTTTI